MTAATLWSEMLGLVPTGTGADRRSVTARRRRRVWGRRLAAGLAVTLVVGIGIHAIPRLFGPADDEVCPEDAVQARAVQGVVSFAAWLRTHGAQGYVGEVGWPAGFDRQAWDRTAQAWYRAADIAGLPTTAWAAGRWSRDYPMWVYRASTVGGYLDEAGPQAAVVERHLQVDGVARGVAIGSGTFGASDVDDGYSNADPGRYGWDYTYESAKGYAFLARRGIRLVRLGVSWERLQRRPAGPLDAKEVARLLRALTWAEQAGLKVVLDLHSYGTYALADGGRVRQVALGTPELPVSALADLWRRLAEATSSSRAIVGYDLMNEPARLAVGGAQGALVWEAASQGAVEAIRQAGGTATVVVAGYGSSSPVGWPHLHPEPWIEDPLGDVAYEVHSYFDEDGSGHYDLTYDQELAALAGGGRPACVHVPAVPMTTLSRWDS